MATLRELSKLSRIVRHTRYSLLLVPVGSTPPCENTYDLIGFDSAAAEISGDLDSEYQLWHLDYGVIWGLLDYLYIHPLAWTDMLIYAKGKVVVSDQEIEYIATNWFNTEDSS